MRTLENSPNVQGNQTKTFKNVERDDSYRRQRIAYREIAYILETDERTNKI